MVLRIDVNFPRKALYGNASVMTVRQSNDFRAETFGKGKVSEAYPEEGDFSREGIYFFQNGFVRSAVSVGKNDSVISVDNFFRRKIRSENGNFAITAFEGRNYVRSSSEIYTGDFIKVAFSCGDIWRGSNFFFCSADGKTDGSVTSRAFCTPWEVMYLVIALVSAFFIPTIPFSVKNSSSVFSQRKEEGYSQGVFMT